MSDQRSIPTKRGPVVPLLAFGYAAVLVALPVLALVLGVVDGLRPTLVALASSEAMGALSRTVALTTAALVVNVGFGVITALVLVRHTFPGRRLLAWFTDLPLAMSPVTIGLAFFLIVGRSGWLQPVLDALELDVVFAFPGMLLVTIFVTFPFVVRETALVLEEIGSSEEEAAATLGATPWQTFRHVTLPNIFPGVASGAALLVARALGEFGAVLVIGGAVSGETSTATTFVFHAVEERQIAAAYGMSMVLVALSMGALAALAALRKGMRR